MIMIMTMTNTRLFYHIVILAISFTVAAGWGVCTGDNNGCMLNTDSSSCHSQTENSYDNCKWFDIGWLIGALVVTSFIAVVSSLMLFKVSGRVDRLEERLPKEEGETTNEGDENARPLLSEPTVPQQAWDRVGL
mmetsp:Transcript_18579/g.34191  ORF Transcript_18579/g.34191 Transcript_18579/m.34191 type:complete len:134 (-) Transcript_18579:301-702(-)